MEAQLAKAEVIRKGLNALVNSPIIIGDRSDALIPYWHKAETDYGVCGQLFPGLPLSVYGDKLGVRYCLRGAYNTRQEAKAEHKHQLSTSTQTVNETGTQTEDAEVKQELEDECQVIQEVRDVAIEAVKSSKKLEETPKSKTQQQHQQQQQKQPAAPFEVDSLEKEKKHVPRIDTLVGKDEKVDEDVEEGYTTLHVSPSGSLDIVVHSASGKLSGRRLNLTSRRSVWSPSHFNAAAYFDDKPVSEEALAKLEQEVFNKHQDLLPFLNKSDVK